MKKKKNLNDSLDELLVDLPTDDEIKEETNQQIRIRNGKNSKLANGVFPTIMRNNGLNTGYQHYQNGTGLFAMNDKKKKQSVINGGKAAGKLAVENGTVSKAGKISAKSKNHVNNKTLKCPHCKMKAAYPTMMRWHMDNCRFKKVKK